MWSLGYGFEWNDFKAQDGFVIRLHHFWRGRNNETGVPVLLAHPLLTNGDSWLLTDPQEAFPFLLADCGYDVWILNFRGTKYSPVEDYKFSYT